MNISMRKRSIVAVLVAGAIAPVAPAAAGTSGPFTEPPQADQTSQKEISDAIILRRDGDRSTPFQAEVSPEAASPGDDFDWGDAAIGAGAGLAAALLVGAGSTAIRGRRSQAPPPARTA